ncbi:MAG: hypothetical protein ACLPZR_04955, partial [Solirubrobacteraceae bacterium]
RYRRRRVRGESGSWRPATYTVLGAWLLALIASWVLCLPNPPSSASSRTRKPSVSRLASVPGSSSELG